MTDNDRSGWEITFIDMLTLLLTFFVFIIAVSRFTDIEYRKFWETVGEVEQPPKRPATTSFKFDLIKRLKLSGLDESTELLLNEIEQVFVASSFEGVDVNYNENKITLMISEQLSFNREGNDIKEEAKILLSKLIKPINQSKFDVSVEGHSDAQTLPQIDNMELSLRQALVVARFMLANGIDRQKISVSGYGPHRPIATNRTPEGRQLNRRVEIHIIIRNV